MLYIYIPFIIKKDVRAYKKHSNEENDDDDDEKRARKIMVSNNTLFLISYYEFIFFICSWIQCQTKCVLASR